MRHGWIDRLVGGGGSAGEQGCSEGGEQIWHK